MDLLQTWNLAAAACIQQQNWAQAKKYLAASMDLVKYSYHHVCAIPPDAKFHFSPMVAPAFLVAPQRDDLMNSIYPHAFVFRYKVPSYNKNYNNAKLLDGMDVQAQERERQNQNAGCVTACALYNLALVKHMEYVHDQSHETALTEAVAMYELAAQVLLEMGGVQNFTPCDSSLLLLMAICDNLSKALVEQCQFAKARRWKDVLSETVAFVCPCCRDCCHHLETRQYLQLGEQQNHYNNRATTASFHSKQFRDIKQATTAAVDALFESAHFPHVTHHAHAA